MFHDPEMEVTCDKEDCFESVFLPMDWSVGGYDLRDSKAESMLIYDHEWGVVDGKHFCCDCKED